ncbi:MAG: hotdog fold thioesterase [Pseudobacteriovorax sp.]|nr:hotdog fold thioesterase [Pseudobacteriovorax sp.]
MFFKKNPSLDQLNSSLTAVIDRHCEMIITKINDAEKSIKAEIVVNEKVLQPFGLLHGGVTCLLAESLGSLAGNLTLESGFVAVGQSLNANHVSSGRLSDKIQINGTNIHWGRRSQIWQIDFTNGEKLVSRIYLTLMNLESKR